MTVQIQMQENKLRQKPYQRNPKLEALLTELNELLASAEAQINRKYRSPAKPLLFIVGAPRSGTTLMLQWLANSGLFGYITNFNARFFSAPALGAKIQQMLQDPQYAFGKELELPGQGIPFQSDLGKTEGLFSPNEFWYFWRRFFPFSDIGKLSADELAGVEMDQFQKELAALEDVFNKPLVLKAMIINWNLRYLAEKIPAARFIVMKRQPFFNIRSLLTARKKFFGSIDEWYSFKPPEYAELKYLDPYRQVAGQVYYTNQAIEEELSAIEAHRYVKVSYEDFCSNPRETWEQIKNLAAFPEELRYNAASAFVCSNRYPGVDRREDRAICDAYFEMFAEDITPQTK